VARWFIASLGGVRHALRARIQAATVQPRMRTERSSVSQVN